MVHTLPHGCCQRELRLFTIACVRRIWPLLPDSCRDAILVAEDFVNGKTTEHQLNLACSAAAITAAELGSGGRAPDSRAYAASAAADASSIWPRTPANVLAVSSCAASAVACAAAEFAEDNYDQIYDLAWTKELVAQANLLRTIVVFPVP